MGSDGFESRNDDGHARGETDATTLTSPRFADDTAARFAPAADAAADLVEISGVIKWFDASKGYGFIIPDNGWPTSRCCAATVIRPPMRARG